MLEFVVIVFECPGIVNALLTEQEIARFWMLFPGRRNATGPGEKCYPATVGYPQRVYKLGITRGSKVTKMGSGAAGLGVAALGLTQPSPARRMASIQPDRNGAAFPRPDAEPPAGGAHQPRKRKTVLGLWSDSIESKGCDGRFQSSP